jgi:two-component system chemotaxis response regulator CheB
MSFSIVAVGTSLGGFEALSTILDGLPADFRLPIVVVQHRSLDDPAALAQLVASRTRLPVSEVDDKEPIQPGHVYLGPPNYHLMIDRDYFSLSMDSPVLCARPSIDVLFESAADSYGSEVVAVLLTGASRDGTNGLAKVKRRGGFTIVQDPATAGSPVMPASAIAAIKVDRILPVAEIPVFLNRLVQETSFA